MKKRLFTRVLSVLLLIVLSVFGFAGCNPTEEEKKIFLNETAKELVVGESFTLTATTTPADAEVVWSTSNEAIVTVEDGTVTAISVGAATVTAKNDTVTATCEITVKAAPIVETKEYTVIFKNGETELKSVKVKEGSTVSYNGVIPSKASTEQYSYAFSGWALSADGEAVDISTIMVDGDKTLYAIFTETVREYTVSWNIDGATKEDNIAYGATPEYKGTTPTKPTVGNTSYTFKGWASSLSGEVLETLPAVTGNVTYYAVFEEVTAQTKFTVTWKNGDTVLKTDVDVEFETPPVYTGEVPTKDATTEVEYVFAGWATSADGEKLDVFPEVTADVTYYAVFEETARKYVITWVIEGVECTSQAAYGSVPTYEGTPVKADSTECSYKFVGWALSEDGEVIETLPAVNGEATYYAVFTVDTVFEAPKFTSGNIMYSARTQEAFLPEGLLDQDVTLVSVVLKIADATKEVGYTKVSAYENGAWIHNALNTTTVTDEEGNIRTVNVEEQNAVVGYTSEIELSNGDKYTVAIDVYAGVIDELSDFPVFFNNEATAEGYAPVTYGYYIVTKDLGTGSEELAFTQCATTDFSKTCGFNGVLNGQGHTLRFKLTSGGLVGMVLGNGVVENLGIIFEDATTTKYGIFGYITSGAPEIRNCYIEQTNNHFAKTTTFGVMGRPSGKLRLHNTVVYGFNISMENSLGSTTLNETCSNAYVIHGRWNADTLTIATNFTKVYNDGIENGSREVALADIADASTFIDEYWYKENGKLVWKGLEMVTVTWVNGEEETVKTFTKGSYLEAVTLPNNTSTETENTTYYWSNSENGEKVSFTLQSKADADTTYYVVEKKSVRYYTVTWVIDGVETTTNYEYNATAAHDNPVKEADVNYSYEFKGWSLSADGEVVELGAVTADGIVYYAVFEKTTIASAITIAEPILYSCGDSQLFLPQEVEFTLDETVTITSADEATIYYQNGVWANTFALTSEQMQANAIGSFDIKLVKGTDTYLATVKSYAGVIDELSDFPVFFNNDTSAVAPNLYGYYIVTKSLGTGSEELAFTQTTSTDYTGTNGFNGVLDGQGYTLKFKLKSGGLVGMILGNAVIKDMSIIFEDATSTGYGVFGYMTNGAPEIRNCYIEQTNNHYKKTTVYGLMARGNGKLRLHNTVVYGYNIGLDNTTWSNVYLNENSSNAYVIHARSGATSFVISTNFTKVINDGIENGARELALSEVADASGFNDICWNKENDVLTWKGAEDMAVSVYDKKYVETIEEKAYYSTVNSEMILPEGIFADGEAIVDARDENGTDYYENSAWQNLAVSTSTNEKKETTLIIETSKGYFYQVTVGSYAGVIDELSDFTAFFNNDTSANAPNVYGYYVVTKDLGTGSEELAFTQTTSTDYSATNGFNGVLDGQGHTLRFKLKSGGLVGMILGNAVIQNLGIIFEDATSTGYGVFGYMTNGAPEIRNCYIEQTNNHYKKTTVYGLMARGNGKLRLHNTVVYGYNIGLDNTTWSNVYLNENSSNAYVIHARSGATSFVISTNFTKVINDGIENGSRELALTEITDANGFDDNYWYKENGKLIWKGLDVVNVSWKNGQTTTVEPFTKGSVMQFPELTEAYWSTTENGDPATLSGIIAQEDCTYYAVYVDKIISEKALYSTLNNEFFLPDSMGLNMNDIVHITNEDGTVTYYEDGAWAKGFALTGEQIQANETSETAIKVYDGESNYFVTVKSYAGVLDELSDFPKFFNTANEANAAANTYGYYVVIKNLDFVDMVVTMNHTTGYGWGNSGFLGVLDGMGHTISCTLKGYLLGNELGTCTIKNISLKVKLVASGEAAGSVSGNVGILADLCNAGTPTIENAQFVVLGEVPTYTGFSCWYIMARPKGNLVLKNVVVQADLTKVQAATDYQISASSSNAFIVWARAAMITSGQATNFTEVSSSGALTNDLSVLDSTYWTTTENKPTWKGLADTAVTSAGEIEIKQQYLVENGSTVYAIVLPDGADNNLTLAKDELVCFFEEATGATLTVAADGAYDKNSTYISIGNTKAFAASGLALGEVNDQGYCINTNKNMIYINANSSLGCIYGVYGLLNELFDYEQFSVDCYTLNGASTVEVPVLNVTENPDFEVRYPVSGTVTGDDTYAMRLKMADKTYVLPAGDYNNNNGAGWRSEHNVLEILPPDYWKAQGKTNWFSDDGLQLCYTAHGNSDDYTAMVEQIVDVMTLTLGSDSFLASAYDNAKYIAISGEDGDGYCTCSACQTAKATYGSDAGAAIKLCNDVREGLETWMNNNPKYKRDLTLLFLAYNKYFEAPVTLNKTTGKYELNGGLTLRSDVGIWVAGSSYAQYYYDINATQNEDFKEAFQKWVDVTEVSGSPLCLWTYSLNNNEYMIHTDMYGESAFYNENAYQYFASKGVDMYYNQGPWNATNTVTAFNRLNIYLDSQLMWDSTQSVVTLTDKYFNAMYGAGASYMKQLYAAENEVSRELFDPDIEGVPNDQVQNSFTAWLSIMSSSKLNTWLGYIDSAKSAVNADTTLTEEQKATYIDHINEEWIAVKYWQMRYHGTSIKDAAKAEFREVLGYDEATGTYAKDVTIGERYSYTLTQWIENGFSAP